MFSPRIFKRAHVAFSFLSLTTASAVVYAAHHNHIVLVPRVFALENVLSPLSTEARRVPSTSVDFPARIEPASSASSLPLCLVGAGVRTVSFLGIKVYCAGLYVPEHLLRRLKYHVGWKNFSADAFLASPHPSTSSSIAPSDLNRSQGSESFLSALLDEPVDIAIRIVPTRSTDFTHLRDGFIRGVTARLKTIGQVDSASAALQQLQSLFPKKSMPKGSSLLLIHDAQGGLIVEYEGQKLGRVDDKLVAKELFLAYFANEKPISAPFKSSVADGFQALFEQS